MFSQLALGPKPAEGALDGAAVDPAFLCPISRVIMKDPVIASDGRNYDRGTLTQWMKTCDREHRPRKSPMSGGILNDNVFPNVELRGRIEAAHPGTTAPVHKLNTAVSPGNDSGEDDSSGNDPASGSLRTFSGHTDKVKRVSLAGGQLATGSCDKTAKLWDAATGALLRTFSGHARRVMSVSLAGGQLATGSEDKTAKLWDTATGACLRTFSGHIDNVTFVSLAGGQLATGSDKTAKLWDTATGALLQTFSGHTDCVGSVSLAGGQLATGSLDNTAKLWNAATGALLRTFSGHTRSVYSVNLAGGQLATGSGDNTAKLWG